jgi:C-terminal processing protease CtpA/Prc
LTLTTALYYTKSGNSIQARGVKPDIEVAGALDVAQGGSAPGGQEGARRIMPEIREEDLPGAIANPGERDEAGAMRKLNRSGVVNPDLVAINPETVEIGDWGARDPQFRRAFDLLKTFTVFQGK